MKRSKLRLAAILVAGLMLLVSTTVSAEPGVNGTADAFPAVISATGVGQVGVAAGPQVNTLNVGVHQQVDGDPEGAVQSVQQAMEKVRAALIEQLKLPDSAVQVMNYNIYPTYGPMAPQPVSSGVPAPDVPTVQGYNIDENLQVDITGPEQLAKAMKIAIAAGATSVNSYTRGGPDAAMPDAAAIAPAVAQATAQAKALAQASADAAGLKLGKIRSVSVQPPMPWYNGGPGASGWRVNVTVTYDIAP